MYLVYIGTDNKDGYPFLFSEGKRAPGWAGGVSKNFFLPDCDTWQSTGIWEAQSSRGRMGEVRTCTASAL